MGLCENMARLKEAKLCNIVLVPSRLSASGRNKLHHHHHLRVSPRSPTARVHVAAGGNIIWNPFLLMAKCRGDGREPTQRMQRCRRGSVVLSSRRVLSYKVSPLTTLGALLPPLKAPALPPREAY